MGLIDKETELNWENHFSGEYFELEDRMADIDIELMNKSKLRLALEKGILDWHKYEDWILKNYECPSLKKNINETILKNFSDSIRDTFKIYSKFDFWSEDLLPVFTWDNKVYVLGLNYNKNLAKISNAVFILAPPEVMSYFSNIVYDSTMLVTDVTGVEDAVDSALREMIAMDVIDGVDTSAKPSDLDFKTLATEFTVAKVEEERKKAEAEKLEQTQTKTNAYVSNVTKRPIGAPAPSKAALNTTAKAASPAPAKPPVQEVKPAPPPPVEPPKPVKREATLKETWDFIKASYDECNFEAKKHFDAYIVLKVLNDVTGVFKMDEQLAKEDVSEGLFKFSMYDYNGFAKVYRSRKTEIFEAPDLGLNIRGYDKVCISPLKRGNEVVGFLVGLKVGDLSDEDKILLDDLARESVAA